MKPTANREESLERLQKVLAAGGLGSRRQCEELILEGRVDVDREVVTELGTKVNPATQAIRVDGIPLRRQRRHYFVVHKPAGVLSTSKDQWRRTRVIDLVDSNDRLFTIGRLDKESSGLILVTNDGDLANCLTHPKFHVPKTYHVTVAGSPGHEVIQKLRRGVMLSDGPVKPESVIIKKRLKQSTLLEIILAEGRNREIRRMLARFDHKVVKLHRVAFGPIRLGVLPRGAHRELAKDEIRKLKLLEANTGTEKKKPRRKKKSAASSKTGGARAKRKLSSIPKMGAVIGGTATKDKKVPRTTSKPKGRVATKKKATKKSSVKSRRR
jgi:23S rRNA pseudouridine2605 synthase